MLGSAELRLDRHHENMRQCLVTRYSTLSHSDTLHILLSDGDLSADPVVLAAVSPFLKHLLQSVEHDLADDQRPVLHLPDVSEREMRTLLDLVYTGSTSADHSHLSSLLSLTHTLKLISIPVTVIDDEPVKKKRRTRSDKDDGEEKATLTFTPSKHNTRGRPAKHISSKPQTNIKDLRLDTLRSDLISSSEKQASEDDMEEMIEEMEVYVTDDGHVEKLEMLLNKSKHDVESKIALQDTEKLDAENITVLQADDGEGLDNLISVAEAFERSQQPDFNDIASHVVDNTDTEKHLVRNCVICSKSLLGRNALSRHMRNVHPKVFGPYKCSFNNCGKMIDSGTKMMTHVYSHMGLKSRGSKPVNKSEENKEPTTTEADKLSDKDEISKKKPFLCNSGTDCVKEFEFAKDLVNHMNNVHKMKPWLCEICNKRFAVRQNYTCHMMSSHGDKKNYACDICNKSFSNQRLLYSHRALHLGKRYLCQECGFRARSSANLRGHVKTRHEAKQHSCQVCSRKFSSGSNLKNHMRVHTGESPYNCDLCGVKFKRVHHLHSHIESKSHSEMIEQCSRKGVQVPKHLDPLRRNRGRHKVEDGPVTLSKSSHPVHITEVNDEWPLHQVVVVEENVGDFSIPVDQAQIEIIDEEHNESLILSV